MANETRKKKPGKRRKRGRPHNGAQLDIRWSDVDGRYVYGEIRVWSDGRTALYFPSQRELGRRHGVHQGTIQRWASQNDATIRRNEARKQHTIEELWTMARNEGRITIDEGAVCPDALLPLEDGTFHPLIGIPEVHTAPQQSDGRERPATMVPRAEIERLLVHGEPRQTPEGGWTFHYPTFQELADRYLTTVKTIRWISDRTNAIQRREEVQEMIRAGLDEAHAALRIDTETRARARVVSIVDRWLDKFEHALDDGKITATSIPDLERLVNLRERLLDLQRQQVRDEGELSLRDLEQRHLNAVRRVGALPSAATGVVKD